MVMLFISELKMLADVIRYQHKLYISKIKKAFAVIFIMQMLFLSFKGLYYTISINLSISLAIIDREPLKKSGE